MQPRPSPCIEASDPVPAPTQAQAQAQFFFPDTWLMPRPSPCPEPTLDPGHVIALTFGSSLGLDPAISQAQAQTPAPSLSSPPAQALAPYLP